MKKVIFYIAIQISFFGFSQEKLSIYFDFDKYNINEVTVKKINSWIAEGKNYEVLKLYGFCDSKGTNLYNDTLAMKRVNEVYKYLTNNKISVKKDIEIRGFGENFEQSSIQDENRRVTIIFQEIKEKPIANPEKEKPLKEKFVAVKKGAMINIKGIKFYNNSAKPLPKSEPYMYELLCVLNDNPNLKIEIQGHICCKTPNQPDEISAARAKTVYNYLIKNKINRTRLSYKGYGVSRPLYTIPEKNAQEEEENRRVEILVLEN